MAPKKRIKKRKPTKSEEAASRRKVHKRKLQAALKKKASASKAKAKSTRKRNGTSPSKRAQSQKSNHQPPINVKRPRGRPNRFDQSEEAFLRNVPAQLREFTWRPGQSGNLKGRPKGIVNLTGRLRAVLTTPIDNGRKPKKGEPRQTYADELMALAVQAARKGDYRFFQHIYERMEGKVPEHLVIEAAKKMVAQEAEALAMRLVKIATDTAEEVFGPASAQKYREKLAAVVTERFKAEDAGSLAG